MGAFEANRAFEADAMPTIKMALQGGAGDVILGRAAQKTRTASLRDASPEQDMREATDLKFEVVTTGTQNHDIAVRCRRFDYWKRYDHRMGCGYREQFTIRRQTKSKARTEIHKIMDGYGTFMMYAFESAGGADRLVQYVVLDLDVFRKHARSVGWSDVPNGDGTRGAAFALQDFPDHLVVCRYDADRRGGQLYVPVAVTKLPELPVASIWEQAVLF
jgi:hypothetical protein